MWMLKFDPDRNTGGPENLFRPRPTATEPIWEVNLSRVRSLAQRAVKKAIVAEGTLLPSEAGLRRQVAYMAALWCEWPDVPDSAEEWLTEMIWREVERQRPLSDSDWT